MTTDSIEPTLGRAVKTRHITHITVGNPDWVPVQEDLDKIRDDFQKAELGSGIFTTRSGVRVHNVEIIVPEDQEVAESNVLAAALEYATSESPANLRALREASIELKRMRDEQALEK